MTEQKRILIVEYLRGIASLSVAWFHLTNTYAGGPVRASGSLGWLGVDVFFVLSGFIIPYSLWTRKEPYSIRASLVFLLRRIIRVEPPYLASIVIVIVLWHLSPIVPGYRGTGPEYNAAQVASHLFYFIPLTDYQWLQPVYWSLAYEFAFYIMIALAYGVLSERAASPIWLIASAGLVLSVAVGYIDSQVLLFVIGLSAFRNIVGLENRFLTVAVTICSAVMIAYYGTLATALIGLLTGIIIRLGTRIELRNTVGKTLLFLGTISYSLYLVHVPIGGRVVNMGTRIVAGAAQELLLSALALVVSLICAWIFFKLVERPSTELARLFARRPGSSNLVAN